jgi:isopenicillin N synthase-like dioxygenase
VIDIGCFLSSAASTKSDALLLQKQQRQTAVELGAACEHVGFFYVKNHGVDLALLEAVRSMARTFFGKSLDHKMLSGMHQRAGPSMFRGYQQLGQNVTENARDWHEAVDMFRELSAKELSEPRLAHLLQQRPELSTVLRGKNIHPPEFQAPLIGRYIRSMHGLGSAVMRAMALSLELPQNYFHDHRLTDDSFWYIRFIHYPGPETRRNNMCAGEAGADIDKEGLGCGAHTDYGCLTIVNQDESPAALQVQARDGTWVMAQPVQGALCLNIGDVVENWTCGLYKSTKHRVLLPRRPEGRVSVPFFFEPNAAARIDHALSGARVGDRGAERQRGTEKGLVYIEHLYSKLSSNFDLQQR